MSRNQSEDVAVHWRSRFLCFYKVNPKMIAGNTSKNCGRQRSQDLPSGKCARLLLRLKFILHMKIYGQIPSFLQSTHYGYKEIYCLENL